MQYYKRDKYETEENGPYIESALYLDDLGICRMFILIPSGKFSLEEYKLIFKNSHLSYLEVWFKNDSENTIEERLTRKIWYF